MKDVVNPPIYRQFKFVNLFAYWVQYLIKPNKLGFQLAITLGFEVFATISDLVAQGIALLFDIFILDLLLKLLGMVKILLAYSY